MACRVYCWSYGGVLSIEWITGSPVDYVTVVLVLFSSHCNGYYNWMDKLNMVN
jgi:hypothetical protein